MVTVQRVFDAAIMLMDEQSESTGKTQTEDNQEYRFRTLAIISTLLPGLGATEKLKETGESGMPDFSQTIPLEDGLCLGVLPYGLAACLLAGENENLANWFQQRFQEGQAMLPGSNAGVFQPIEPPYGLF